MLSGGRDSVCMLDLAVRARGPEAVSALHVNYGLREEADEDERHCAELCRGLGVRLEVERPRRPEGAGNLQAWAREARYAAAARLAEDRRRDDRHRPHRRRPGRDDPLPARLLAQPAGAAGDAAAGRPPRPAAARRRPARRPPPTARSAGSPGATTPATRRPTTSATCCAATLIPELERIHPAAKENVLRTAALLREEAELLDSLVDAELAGGAGVPAGRSRQARFAELHPALRRLVLQRLADDAAGRPVPGAARFAEQVAGLHPRRLDARPRRRRPRRPRGRRPPRRAPTP